VGLLLTPSEPASAQATQVVCRNASVPPGWISTKLSFDSGSCGGVGRGGFLTSNVVVITQFSTLPIGSELTVCQQGSVPAGWAVIDRPISQECGEGIQVRILPERA
jgi:hypothetical protein